MKTHENKGGTMYAIFGSLIFKIMLLIIVLCLITDIWLLFKVKWLKKENKNLQRELASWKKDYLTGLMSRKFFEEHLIAMFERARANLSFRGFFSNRKERLYDESPSLSIVFIDIDSLSIVNDMYGSEYGTYILKLMAEKIKLWLRIDDIACRYGNPDFAIILKCDNNGALNFLRRLRAEIDEVIKKPNGKIKEKFTFSAGLASFEQLLSTQENLISNGLRALERAKVSGKDCFVVCNDNEFDVVLK